MKNIYYTKLDNIYKNLSFESFPVIPENFTIRLLKNQKIYKITKREQLKYGGTRYLTVTGKIISGDTLCILGTKLSSCLCLNVIFGHNKDCPKYEKM